MNDRPCGRCGAPGSPGSSPGGLCAACLLTTALSEPAGEDPDRDELIDDLVPGSTFGHFVIRRALGRGGMGAVYEAVDTRLDRAVALKVLPPAFLHDRSFRKRFETEARTVAKLEHPNIVPVYATGIQDDVPWMSMRLLTGESLSDLLARGPLEPARATRLLRQVASALDYAHSIGVVHRDVKPANILLDASDNACVADFGLAQLVESGTRLTRTGLVAGTPHYMAPEQALGKRVDHRCDIYSLAIVTYEVLTGAPPFNGESPLAVLLQHVQAPLPAAGGAHAEPRWMPVLRRATAKEPEDRWGSATAFVDALETALTAAAGPWTAAIGSSLPASGERRRWIAAAGVTILAAVTLGWLYGERPSRGPLPPVTSSATQAMEGEPAEASDDVPAPPVQGVDTPPPANKTPPRPAATGSRASRQAAPAQPEEQVSRTEPEPQPLPSIPHIPVRGDPLVVGEGTATLPPAFAPSPPPDVLTEPKVILEVTPEYPEAAKSAQLEGEVVLTGTVGIDGRVTDIKVEREVHKLLADAARRAWEKYQYQPALRNGRPVPARVRKPFSFVLKFE